MCPNFGDLLSIGDGGYPGLLGILERQIFGNKRTRLSVRMSIELESLQRCDVQMLGLNRFSASSLQYLCWLQRSCFSDDGTLS